MCRPMKSDNLPRTVVGESVYQEATRSALQTLEAEVSAKFIREMVSLCQ